MIRTIWKFNLEITDEQVVGIPDGAEFLAVDEQYATDTRSLQLWALVDRDARLRPRRILIHGTGHSVPPSLRASSHIGTVITMNGALVWHVFDGGLA